MLILGIESSCDETAAAVVKDGTKILSNVTATSAGIHARTGGVIPEDAARKQIMASIPVIDIALKDAEVKSQMIDAIAITYGPGLIGSLLVGVETAKTLSYLWKKPLIPVNHLVGHIYANWIDNTNVPRFPSLALVVSGGHTDLVLMKKHGLIKWTGGTRDDAAGEAFDKTARLLGFDYPGGPLLANEADKYLNRTTGNQSLTLFPRPMIDDNTFEWSFSGLKTSVLNHINTLYSNRDNNESIKMADYKKTAKSQKVIQEIPRLTAEIQEAIVDVLVTKTLKAVEKYKPKSLLLAGGVAANRRLTEKFKSEIIIQKSNVQFFVPPPELCTDNAAYIAAAAYFVNKPTHWSKVASNPELSISD